MTTQNNQPKSKLSLENILYIDKSPFNLLMFGVTLILMMTFLTGVFLLFTEGHESLNVTRQHPWGVLLAMYVFLAVSCTGMCIISSLGHIFGIKQFEPIATRSIAAAIIMILSAFMVIGLELGHPFRMVYNFITPNFTSGIWWMGTLYGIYLFFIMIEFYFLQKHDHKFSKIFGLLGLFFGVAASSNLGAVFGFLVARPVTSGIYMPIYIILTAMITACFILFLIYGFKYRLDFSANERIKTMLESLAKLMGLLLGIMIFFQVWKGLTGLYGGLPDRAGVTLEILYSKEFLIGELLFTLVIPFAVILFTKAKNLKAIFFASFIGMVGMFTIRYNMVHFTQLFPMQEMKLREYQLAPTYIEYFPNFTEIAVALGGIGICFVLYHIADRVFDLGE